MFSRAVAIVAVGIASAVSVIAASQSERRPQPTAEHQRLGYFVGQWKTTNPAGSHTCEWFDGRFQVICRSENGTQKELVILGYSPQARGYTRYNIGSAGENAFATGTLDGKTWRWQGETRGGATPKIDFSWTETTQDSYTWKVTQTSDGKSTVLGEGTMTRVK
jgi:hypothetical protein